MIRLIVDSTCEAPQDVLNHPAVHVVPLSVVFGQEALRDNIDITRDMFWQRLATTDTLPTTSQANPSDFLVPFQEYLDAGDEVIALVLSSKLSGTHDSAMIARESFAGRPLDIVDTTSISVGSGMMLQMAVEMVEAGRSRHEIADAMRGLAPKVRLMFALETLEFLQRGGRIGKAQAMVGTLLKFKPLLALQDGEVLPVGRVRTKSKAVVTMLDLLASQVPERGPGVWLGIAHAQVPQEAAAAAEELKKRFNSPHIFISTLGPVIGTHTGPGVIGAAACFMGTPSA